MFLVFATLCHERDTPTRPAGTTGQYDRAKRAGQPSRCDAREVGSYSRRSACQVPAQVLLMPWPFQTPTPRVRVNVPVPSAHWLPAVTMTRTAPFGVTLPCMEIGPPPS